jgi:threonine synthase
MRFYSTKNQKLRVSLKQAVFDGLAEDGGLYMPEKLPKMTSAFFKKLPRLSFKEAALELSLKLLEKDVPKKQIKNIVDKAFTFNAPLKKLDENIFCLELFHGPTLAFKDFGARFMAHLVSWLAKDMKQNITILVATSGDTGSAVASGFFNVPNIQVIILYPKRKVSPLQEKQLTTWGRNITTLEISGTFDDCQKLVKQAFKDRELKKRFLLSSANSINIARLIPQTFYYFHGFGQCKNKKLPTVFSVPSGNFGNLTAGLFAKKMGLPVSRFVASTNVNNVVPKYLKTGFYKPRPSRKTLSNSMDVGNPSNFSRIVNLYGGNLDEIRKDLFGTSFNDAETKAAIKLVLKNYNYLLDPHGAVGYLGLRKYLSEVKERVNGIFLATAHPAKFQKTVETIIGKKVKLPKRLRRFAAKKKHSVKMPKDFKKLKEFLFSFSYERN